MTDVKSDVPGHWSSILFPLSNILFERSIWTRKFFLEYTTSNVLMHY